MSTNEQRKQWADHMADERRALQGQQESAGSSHSPVEGPLPYSVDQLEAAVAGAVAAERSRCAEIAESWRSAAKLLAASADITEAQLRSAADTARRIADEIRLAGSPGA